MKNSMAHIAIAVEDINKAKDFFELISGNQASDPHFVESQKVNTSFVSLGETNFELLEPVGDDTPISNFLSNRGGGIHHICVETENFDELVTTIRSSGVRTLGEPFIGAKGRRVIFFHPKDTYNVLVELEEREE